MVFIERYSIRKSAKSTDPRHSAKQTIQLEQGLDCIDSLVEEIGTLYWESSEGC